MKIRLFVLGVIGFISIFSENKELLGYVSQNQKPFEAFGLQFNPKKIKKWLVMSGRRRSHLTFISIPSGKKFLVKQFKSDCVKAQFGAVRESLSAFVGECVNIPVNRVNIIPKTIQFPGKIFANKPATIHSFVPGSKPYSFNKFKNIDLKQWWRAHVDLANRGMRISLIKDMALHKDLPVIVAFDTFVCNTDRNPTNIFYDPVSDRFYGFDLENSWRRPYDYLLSEIAYHNFSQILNDDSIKLTASEIKGLVDYNKTLKLLFEKVSLKIIHSTLDELAIKAGFVQGRVINRRKTPIDVEKYIQYYKDRIAKHYACTKEVVELVDLLIDEQKRKLKNNRANT